MLRRGETLSERLRAEVQDSAALWQIGPRSTGNAAKGESDGRFPCPREVKPLLFFYKYLQPIGAAESAADITDNSGNPPANKNHSQRKLRVNLPLTVICERTNAQESVLWLRTDAHGNVNREDKTPLWRKKLHNQLMNLASESNENDPVLAVRSVARWKNSNYSNGGSAVVLTKKTLDPILAVPCELPICIQQFVHCRGSQASVYRVFWCEQERKCFAVNLTSSLKNTEAPHDSEVMNSHNITSPSGLSASTMAAMNAAFEAAMVTAAQTARFYCVTVSPDARACARWPKLRGAAIAEGVQATSRVVEHVQMQLPTLRFHSMTTEFIKDTDGVWWLIRVVDFQASSSVEPPRDNTGFGSRDSAVFIPEALRTRYGPHNEQPDDPTSPPKDSTLLRGDELNNIMNTRPCFLCGCSCELSPMFRAQLEAMVKGQSGDEYKTNNTVSMKAHAVDEFRMTLTMALDTIFLMRQRGVNLPVWENAVSTVRKSQLRDVCDFPTCMLCYRIYQQQNRLQLLARELHYVLSPNIANPSEDYEVDTETLTSGGLGTATSAASGLAPQLLSTELRYNQEAPRNVLDSLEAFQLEKIPPSLLLRGDSPEHRPTGSILTPVRGADVDPTATQLRLVFFFHELQDGGPDLDPTDFYLEYQLGQNVTRVQLEGSKRHTPNRWQLCEARVHYLCATLEAFSEFCSQKRLLIKLKAKPRSQSDDSDDEDQERVEEEPQSDSPIRNASRYRDQDEFFGYTLLSLRAVNTAAKWFGNSLQPESRTDYLLELQTASYGLLTLKLTVGLLVDAVPLGHLRDVLRDRIFLEEQPPGVVYWPPSSHYLSGLAVPRDWVGALMPSEYTKLLPMRRRARGVHSTHPVAVLSPTRVLSPTSSVAKITLPAGTLTHQNSGQLEATASLNAPVKASSIRRLSTVTIAKNRPETAGSGSSGDENVGISTTAPLQSEYCSRSIHLLSGSMTRTTLSQACLAAKRLVFRITENAATDTFPTILLAAILRHASFTNPVMSWKSPANFHFTRRYSVDRLLAEVRPGMLPLLALLGELLLVLIEERELSATIDTSALESLLEPFWQHDSGWRPIPRTQTSCVPERRVIWNRAIRRWEAATGNNIVDEIAQPDGSIILRHGDILKADIGEFRTKVLALVVCELFEQMESLDDGYIEIAELRSLAKCRQEREDACVELDADVGTRERLRQEDIVVLAELVDRQRRLALRTLLYSLVGSTVMMDALSRFDRLGSGEMSLEKFRELAIEALIAQRKVFRAFHEEPKKPLDGFCLRHGFTEIYVTDSVCVLCAAEYQAEKSPPKLTKPETSPGSPEPIQTDKNTSADAVPAIPTARFNGERSPTERSSNERKQSLETGKVRRASGYRRLSTDTRVEDDVAVVGPRRRRAVSGKSVTVRQVVDLELDGVLNQLHAAERTMLTGEVQASERKASVASVRTRHSLIATEEKSMPHSRNPRRKSTKTPQIPSQDVSIGPDKGEKKRMKKSILKKTVRRVRSSNQLPKSDSLSKLLRIEFSDRVLSANASESIIEKALRIEQRRKELDRLVLAEVQEVNQRLANLLDDS